MSYRIRQGHKNVKSRVSVAVQRTDGADDAREETGSAVGHVPERKVRKRGFERMDSVMLVLCRQNGM